MHFNRSDKSIESQPPRAVGQLGRGQDRRPHHSAGMHHAVVGDVVKIQHMGRCAVYQCGCKSRAPVGGTEHRAVTTSVLLRR